MIWWLTQPSRALAERAAIAELEEKYPWLEGVSWGLGSELQLTADFTIRHLEDEFALKIVFPSFFPDSPPLVIPREKIRLSNHQWGTGGELCLELRADNWDPSFTGAMMIESAFSLLSGERPATDEEAVVPSAHRLSRAQMIRGEKLRLLITREEGAVLRDLPSGESVELALSEHANDKTWLIHLTRLGPADAPIWAQAQRVVDGKPRLGFALRLPSGSAAPGLLDDDGLRALLAAIGVGSLVEKIDAAAAELYFLFVADDDFKLLCAFPGTKARLVLPYTTVEFPESEARLLESYGALGNKMVGIVGCGSMGSKIAVSLARSGINKFVLVDEDILNPGNLVRNDLDGRAVGMHKVDALAGRLLDINVGAEVSMRRVKLGGQESAATTDSVLRSLAACDVIIDATADAHVFNLCASVARAERKYLLWGEVFGGGIGGIIARARPDLEPPPHAARRQLSAWCDLQGVPWEGKAAAGYDVSQEDAPPLIADDADVSVIAAHLTRLTLDTLLHSSESQFPQSAYAIGLSKAWIFSGPFDTFPITFSAEGEWGPDREPNAAEQIKVLTAELFPDVKRDADAG